DQWLGTIPWFLIIFFLLGGAAGILNLWRVVTGKGLKIGYFK
ncbi:AtpZ/AtpI family protein, partial [Alphaproteobacteria bacterium]|nr:AtpZ/AtpI family protein [Alphaproteobacteria bacterium]